MENYNEVNEEQMENEEFATEEKSNKKMRSTSIWIISILLHSIVIAILTTFMITQAKKAKEEIINEPRKNPASNTKN